MGSLAKIAALVRLHLTQIAHDRGDLFSAFVLPILLTTLLGFMYNQGSMPKAKVALVDLDHSAVSAVIAEELRAQPSFEVTEATRSTALAGVRDRSLSAAVIVPEDFGKRVQAGQHATLDVRETPDSSLAMAVRQVAEGVAVRLSADQLATDLAIDQLGRVRSAFLGKAMPATVKAQLAKTMPYLESDPAASSVFAVADGFWTPAPVKVESRTLAASKVRGASTDATGHDQSSLGVTVWFVLMLLLGSAVTLLEERENRTLPRLLTTPTPRGVILLGKIAGLFLVGLVQAAVLIGFGALVFHVQWGSDPLAVAVVVVAYTLAATGLAVAVAAVARTRSQASAVGPVLSVSLAMLGGCMWPLSIVPPAMRTVAAFTPTGQAMTALTDVVVRSRGIGSALAPALALLAMAVVFFTVGVSRFKYE